MVSYSCLKVRTLLRIYFSQLRDTGWIRIHASSAINRLTTKINNVILVGDELGKTIVQHSESSFENGMELTNYSEEIRVFRGRDEVYLLCWCL